MKAPGSRKPPEDAFMTSFLSKSSTGALERTLGRLNKSNPNSPDIPRIQAELNKRAGGGMGPMESRKLPPKRPLTFEEIMRMPEPDVQVIEESAKNLPVNDSLGSGSGGSVEAIRRPQRFVLESPGGTRTPTTEDGGIRLRKGWKFIQIDPDGFETILNEG